jgi:glycosyltransferase involved in cell wall biosynthesis
MRPAVSVITPYLSADRFLGEAIDSVRAQSFDEWELLLIDDGSSDRSREIADAAAAEDPRIQSLARPLERIAGAASARNWGVEQARGDYLVFLDADDRFLAGKLATEHALMQEHPDAGVVCGGTIWWHPGHDSRNWSDEARGLRPGLYPGSTLLNRFILLQRFHVPCLCAVMVRRTALPSPAAFETAFALYEDQSLLAKLALTSPVYIGRHLTALYRQHSESTSSRAEQQGDYARVGPHGARAEFLHWLRRHVEESPANDSEIAEALLIAEARQCRDYSKLTLRQRATVLLWKMGNAATRIPRRVRRWLRNKISGAA